MSINFTTLATGALSFTLALAWNNAVSKTIQSFFPPKSEKAAARATMIYALVVTIFVIGIVAIINGTRRIVHNHTSKLNGQDDQSMEPPSNHGTSPIIRLWEPRNRETRKTG